jgi:hypothetical protein
MRLIPVVELSPELFRAHDHPFSAQNTEDAPAAWDRYYQACLADAGISGVTLFPGTCLVPVSSLTESGVMEALVIHNAEASGYALANWDADNVGPLNGGYILLLDDGTTILPTCCGDLDNIREWEKAAAHNSSDEEQIWIGHPWLMVSAQGDYLHFHWSEADALPEMGEFEVIRQQLQQAIDVAYHAVSAFRERLLSTLGYLHTRNPEELAQLLISRSE